MRLREYSVRHRIDELCELISVAMQKHPRLRLERRSIRSTFLMCDASDKYNILNCLSFYKNTRLAVASLLDDYKIDRNAMCAGMFWASKLERDVRGENLATKAFEYFETYGHKTFCFNDLQPYVGAMQPPVMQCFLHKVRAWLMGRGYGFSHLNQDKVGLPYVLT